MRGAVVRFRPPDYLVVRCLETATFSVPLGPRRLAALMVRYRPPDIEPRRSPGSVVARFRQPDHELVRFRPPDLVTLGL